MSILTIIEIYLRTYWLVLSLFAFCLFEFLQILYFYIKVYPIYNANKKYFDKNNSNEPVAISKEEAIDDISDELVDSSNVSKIIEDNTDNFEDTVDSEDDNK